MQLDHLNPPQREAVLHDAGPLVVFAGAGSGKTRVITHRVAHLVSVRDVRPWRILSVTFTNKAAGEMRERLHELVGSEASDLWVGTFHAVCARLLRRYHEEAGVRRDFNIYDDSDQQALVKRVLRDLGLDDRRFAPKKVAGRINRAKQEVLGPEEMPVEDVWTEQVQRLYSAYQERLDMAGALDFGDLIYRLVVALERNEELRQEVAGRYEHVLVDEFQDTNHVQYRLLRNLCAEHRNLTVVGDDDQSIYRWRGADRRNILGFREHYPDATIIKLEQNYRSSQRILRAANAVIARNGDREPKELWSENREGNQVVVVATEDERDEASMVVRAVRELQRDGHALSEMVLFYRIHAQSRVFEEALRASNVSYRVVGGMRFYDRAEIKDLLAYLRVLHNPDDDVSLLRVINTPARGIGKTTVERLLDQAAQAGTGLWQAIRSAGDNERIGAAARKKLGAFAKLVEELRGVVNGGATLPEIGQAIADRTGYLQMLRDQDTPEADARMQNIEELLGSLQEFQDDAESPSLESFLELVTLQTSADEAEEGDRLTLMTVHAAKGLEFPVVMVAGLEEGMFPFRGTDPREDAEELEEERRLAYVAFTRAEQRLLLSWAKVRRVFGRVQVNEPSRFLEELPQDDVAWLGGPAPWKRSRSAGGADWDRPPRDDGRPASPAPGETVVDTSEGSDLDGEGVRRGMHVRHPKFGVGRVEDVGQGLSPRVTVEFPGWGRRKIVASYLEPA